MRDAERSHARRDRRAPKPAEAQRQPGRACARSAPRGLRSGRFPPRRTRRRAGDGRDRRRRARALARCTGNGPAPRAPFSARRRLRARLGSKRRRARRAAGTRERDASALPRIPPGARASVSRRHRRRRRRMALAPPRAERAIHCLGRRVGRWRARSRASRRRTRCRGGVARGRCPPVSDRGSHQLGRLDDRARGSGSDLHASGASSVRRRLPRRGRSENAARVAALCVPDRSPAAPRAGGHGRRAAQRFRTARRGSVESRSRRGPRDRRGAAPCLPAHARHARGGRRYGADSGSFFARERKSRAPHGGGGLRARPRQTLPRPARGDRRRHARWDD